MADSATQKKIDDMRDLSDRQWHEIRELREERVRLSDEIIELQLNKN